MVALVSKHNNHSPDIYNIVLHISFFQLDDIMFSEGMSAEILIVSEAHIIHHIFFFRDSDINS